MNPVTIAIACPGIGRVRRGFESFFLGCVEALQAEPAVNLAIYGGGPHEGPAYTRLWNLPRDGAAARLLGRALGRSSYFAEQFTFFIAFVPHLLFLRPQVVYVSDVVLANLLRLLKRALRCRFAILFNNNGPVLPQLLHRWDHIQQVSPQYWRAAVEAGLPASRQTLIPSALQMPAHWRAAEGGELPALRRRLGLPVDKRVLLSVGALNRRRKRMHYLIEEVARLPTPRPFLLLVGAHEAETPDILDTGIRLLGPEGFAARSVPRHEVPDYYRSADLFVLASLDEGFGLAYAEAMAHGLPCLAHDYETAHFVLGDLGCYADLTRTGALAGLIARVDPVQDKPELAAARHAYIHERFSWARLAPRYVELFQRCAG